MVTLGFPYPDGSPVGHDGWTAGGTPPLVVSSTLAQVNVGLFQNCSRPLTPFVPAAPGWKYAFQLKRTGGSCGDTSCTFRAYGPAMAQRLDALFTVNGGTPSAETVYIFLFDNTGASNSVLMAFSSGVYHDVEFSYDGATVVVKVDGVTVLTFATVAWSVAQLNQLQIAMNTLTNGYAQWSVKNLTIDTL